MKLPRNLSGQDLIKKLRKLGYQVVRQKGSHIRLVANRNGVHKITIPNSDSIPKGTLSQILYSVATHFKIDKKELIKQIKI